jgi:hypothetical protein
MILFRPPDFLTAFAFLAGCRMLNVKAMKKGEWEDERQ